jgi:hypothetical protein
MHSHHMKPSKIEMLCEYQLSTAGAIILHKGFAAFAMGSVLVKAVDKTLYVTLVCLRFSSIEITYLKAVLSWLLIIFGSLSVRNVLYDNSARHWHWDCS